MAVRRLLGLSVCAVASACVAVTPATPTVLPVPAAVATAPVAASPSATTAVVVTQRTPDPAPTAARPVLVGAPLGLSPIVVPTAEATLGGTFTPAPSTAGSDAPRPAARPSVLAATPIPPPPPPAVAPSATPQPAGASALSASPTARPPSLTAVVPAPASPTRTPPPATPPATSRPPSPTPPNPTSTRLPPTATAAAAAPASSVQIVSAPGTVARARTASLAARTTPGARCTITVTYRTTVSTAAGLEPKTADANGAVTWSWTVGTSTTAGTWPVKVVCGAYEASTTLTVP